jgi:TolA-binding protein
MAEARDDHVESDRLSLWEPHRCGSAPSANGRSGAGLGQIRPADPFPTGSVSVTLAAMRRVCATIVLAAGLPGLAGCSGLTEQQRAWLAEGRQAFEQEQYTRAIQQLTRFLDEVQGKPETTEALYVRGMSHAKSGERAQAYNDLRRCVGVASNPDVGWRAQVVLGTLNFEDERWDAAGQAYGAAAKTMPSVPPMDAVLFRIGQCYERTGRWTEAQGSYRALVDHFPAGVNAAAARRRMQLNADHFAVQCGVFSQRENADRLRMNLEASGLEAYVRQEPRDQRTMYVVLVGRYTSYGVARQQLGAVRAHVRDAVLWP